MPDEGRSPRRKPEPRKHHLVSVMYLKGFADEAGTVCTYETASGRHYFASPREVATENDAYSVFNPEGNVDTKIERLLSKVESDAAAPLRKLMGMDRLTRDDRGYSSYFLATMYLRSRFTRIIFAEAENGLISTTIALAAEEELLHDLLAEMADEDGLALDENIEQRLLQIAQHYSELEWYTHREATLGAFDHVDRLAAIILRSSWSIAIFPDDFRFITSDNPAVRYFPNEDPRQTTENNLLNHTMEFFLPFSPRVLWMSHHDDRPTIVTLAAKK